MSVEIPYPKNLYEIGVRYIYDCYQKLGDMEEAVKKGKKDYMLWVSTGDIPRDFTEDEILLALKTVEKWSQLMLRPNL